LTRIDKDRGHKTKPNNLELLGHCFVDASNDIGYGYPYGNQLLVPLWFNFKGKQFLL
jgi:hypothetical protein